MLSCTKAQDFSENVQKAEKAPKNAEKTQKIPENVGLSRKVGGKYRQLEKNMRIPMIPLFSPSRYFLSFSTHSEAVQATKGLGKSMKLVWKLESESTGQVGQPLLCLQLCFLSFFHHHLEEEGFALSSGNYKSSFLSKLSRKPPLPKATKKKLNPPRTPRLIYEVQNKK